MKKTNETALKVAQFLMQVKAVKLQPNNPFTWSSGWKSPIYCDNRITLSYPKIRNYIRQELANAITDNFGKPDVIAGVATGAIAVGVLVAQDLGLPFIYVRPDAKSHGLGNQIEGYLEPKQTVIVIEDLVSTGGSSLKAIEALKNAGCSVKGMAAISTYGFETAVAAFKKAKCPLVTLTNYEVILEQALSSNYINETEYASLIEWHKDPIAWTELHK
ncbi:MAG: orotate phosphoribosyltransferase [Bacteroidota bacterium]